ncbi:MAG TPA: hypothetical protein VFW40_12750, partial [Capsulimonadaceae bacterium]|nr:hypothetical protein [Capsulimonadaceae bacterium]
MRCSRIVLVSIPILLFAAPALAKPSPNLRATFQALYARMDKADMNKDLNGFMALYDPNYIGIDVDNGTTNADQFRQNMQFMFGEDRDMHTSTKVG